jgi:hypothetical protein
MAVEVCLQCGFDGTTWTDDAALVEIGRIPDRWVGALRAVPPADAGRRPIAGMWSIAEYVDHVRETFFGMRFVVDTALDAPGTDLGAPPTNRFDPEPRAIDVDRSLSGLRREAALLGDRLQAVSVEEWTAEVVLDGETIDLRWVARHAVHDATHHLADVARLRSALE